VNEQQKPKPLTGPQIRRMYARWAAASVAGRLMTWKSGGVPGGRREYRSQAEASARYFTPEQYQRECLLKRADHDDFDAPLRRSGLLFALEARKAAELRGGQAV
jgi:hypothetical protein